MNAAMNAHIAQFVKGAHVLTTLGVLVCCLTVAPLIILFLNDKPEPAKTVILDTVAVSNPHFGAFSQHLSTIDKALAQAIPQAGAIEQRHKTLELKINEIQAQMDTFQTLLSSLRSCNTPVDDKSKATISP